MSEIKERMINEVDKNSLSPVTVEAGARLAIGAVAPELERLEALIINMVKLSGEQVPLVQEQAKRIDELERRLDPIGDGLEVLVKMFVAHDNNDLRHCRPIEFNPPPGEEG